MKQYRSRIAAFAVTLALLIGAFGIYAIAQTPITQIAEIELEEAVVYQVIDGDTIELVGGERVRFIGVDAPEMGFAGGEYEEGATEATEFVRNLIDGRTIWLEADGNDRDRFDRLRRYVWIVEPYDPACHEEIKRYQLNALLLIFRLAEVMIIGEPVNEDLFRGIKETLYKYYPYLPEIFEEIKEHIALLKEAIGEERAAAAILAPATTPRPAPEPTPTILPTPTPTPAAATTGNFIGNRNSQIFHTLTCGTLPAPQNRIYFQTRQEALDAGHRACSRSGHNKTTPPLYGGLHIILGRW